MSEKAEVRFVVDEDFLKSLQEKLGQTKTTDVAKTALTLLNWAADEAKNGRFILSSKPDGTEVHRLAVAGVPALTPKDTERSSG
jgi:hypothetical protein